MIHTGKAIFYRRNGQVAGWFRPTGAMRPNRRTWAQHDPVQAARLFVGFNVGERPAWTVETLIGMVREIRQEQGFSPAASFVAQKGMYVHQHSGELIEEDGAQVIILNVDDTPPAKCERAVEQLGVKLADELMQEEVILELQRGGVVYQTMGLSGR
jgi:hypothetical protein